MSGPFEEPSAGRLRRIVRRAARGRTEPSGDSASAADAAQPDPNLTQASRPTGASGRSAPAPANLEELRQDVAALWLAFSQHERVIDGLRTEIARTGGRTIAAPSDHGAEPPASQGPIPPASGPASAPGSSHPQEAAAPLSDVVGDQLADLDDVLAAIEQATRSLEQAHRSELRQPPSQSPTSQAEGAAADQPGAGADQPGAGADQPGAGADQPGAGADQPAEAADGEAAQS